MRFSLIVATIERTECLERLIDTLARQSFRDFEVILVDQNLDDRLLPIVNAWSDRIKIRHLRSEKGLSRSRNRGLALATGEIIAFPDDDCWYAPHTLEEVDSWFSTHPHFDFLSTCVKGEAGQLAMGRWLTRSAEITRRTVFRTHISFSLFFRATAIHDARGFDEQLGLGSGSRFGSGEETDCVLRVLGLGSRGWYERALAVFHPARTSDTSPTAQARATGYGLGFGFVLRRHRIPFFRALYLMLRPAGGWVLSSLFGRPEAAVYSATLRGRLKGYLSKEARTSAGLAATEHSSIPYRREIGQ